MPYLYINLQKDTADLNAPLKRGGVSQETIESIIELTEFINNADISVDGKKISAIFNRSRDVQNRSGIAKILLNAKLSSSHIVSAISDACKKSGRPFIFEEIDASNPNSAIVLVKRHSSSDKKFLYSL